MWIRIRVVIVEDEPLASEYLTALLDETCQVEVVGTATESESGLRLCAELRPDAVFLDINLPEKTGFRSLRNWRCFRGRLGWSSRPGIPVAPRTPFSWMRWTTF